MGWICLAREALGGPLWTYGNSILGSTEGGDFLQHIRDSKLLKDNSITWFYYKNVYKRRRFLKTSVRKC